MKTPDDEEGLSDEIGDIPPPGKKGGGIVAIVEDEDEIDPGLESAAGDVRAALKKGNRELAAALKHFYSMC